MVKGYPRSTPVRRVSDRLVGWGECSYGDPDAWSRRIGPEADAYRVRAVRCGRSARWLLIIYVSALVAVFGVQGFPSTGEAMLPNVLLCTSVLAVLSGEVALTLAEQSSRRSVARVVNAAFGAHGRRQHVIVGDALSQVEDFDHWTAVHRRPWYDGTLLPLPAPRSAVADMRRS